MIELAVLYLLGLLHACLAGYRDAAGRNHLISKTRYFRRATIRGFLVGQLAAGVILATLVGLLSSSPNPEDLLATLGHAGRGAIYVYLGYSSLVGLTFVLYAIPYVEVRSLCTVAIFGPLTLILPFVMIAGAIVAIVRTPEFEVVTLFAVSAGVMLSLDKILAAGGWSKREAERLMA